MSKRAGDVVAASVTQRPHASSRAAQAGVAAMTRVKLTSPRPGSTTVRVARAARPRTPSERRWRHRRARRVGSAAAVTEHRPAGEIVPGAAQVPRATVAGNDRVGRMPSTPRDRVVALSVRPGRRSSRLARLPLPATTPPPSTARVSRAAPGSNGRAHPVRREHPGGEDVDLTTPVVIVPAQRPRVAAEALLARIAPSSTRPMPAAPGPHERRAERARVGADRTRRRRIRPRPRPRSAAGPSSGRPNGPP